MKKIKIFVNKNYKLVIGVIIGLIISGTIAYASNVFKSSDVEYDNTTSGLTSTNLQGAIDELNTKATTKIEEAKASCPDGYICNAGGSEVSTSNSNIVKAYSYNSSTCVTGEESTCKETNCINYTNTGSCPAGTIIKYKVNSSTTKYFHVLHDDGATLTMQQRENTTDNVAWYSSTTDNTQGPTTILPVLESATSSWSNVNDQTYTMGTTVFSGNKYTGCTVEGCTTHTYTLDSRTAKARMITMQEALALGCKAYQSDGSADKTCPNWMNNYLYNSTNYGGTVNDATDSTGAARNGYWTVSANSSSSDYAWRVHYNGIVLIGLTTSAHYGARAVVVVSK